MLEVSLFYCWCQRTVGRRSAGGFFFNHLGWDLCVLVSLSLCKCVFVCLTVLCFTDSVNGRSDWTSVFAVYTSVYESICVPVLVFSLSWLSVYLSANLSVCLSVSSAKIKYQEPSFFSIFFLPMRNTLLLFLTPLPFFESTFPYSSILKSISFPNIPAHAKEYLWREKN